MLTKEQNELLTRTGPGTPCGELMRRYWQPAALSEELPPGGAPLPVRLLGEDLVLFRDDAGRPGLLGLHCSHRGADLSYGRLEDGGLRCIYHGWLYDRNGRCLEQPGEPAGSTFHEKIRHTAYPCIERSGAVFAYLGPGEPSLLPQWEFLSVADEQVFTIKLFSDCNYLQGNEGNTDLIHDSFLHYRNRPESGEARAALNSRGPFPCIESTEWEVTDYGLRFCQITPMGQQVRLKMYTYLVPNSTCFGGGRQSEDGHSVNWHVPIDDEHHWKYTFIFDRHRPLDKLAARRGRTEMTPDYHSVRNRSNRYLQDRESMRYESYSGIGFINQPQDLCVTEGMGAIQDRTQEHLGTTDSAVVAARLLLLQAIQEVQEGREPPFVVRDPSKNRFPYRLVHTVVVPGETDWRSHFKELDATLRDLMTEKMPQEVVPPKT